MSTFLLESTCGQARAGTIKTIHGEIKTPIFMPVGTRGSVKAISQLELEELDAQIILGNTYHLYLKPGHELIEKVGQGGLHGFMSWNRPILTDSGGFQIYSLSHLTKVTDEGVRFRSHIDGSYHVIGPEKSMEIQRALVSDIVMAFDECPSLPATYNDLKKSLELTLEWAKRCKSVSLKDHQKLFGIIQGGLFKDLRLKSLETLKEIGFDGFALGGLSVGEKNEEMEEFCQSFVPLMPNNSPRYLMGVGRPLDILKGIKSGLDMFDCVLPCRNARNGQVFTKYGPLNIKKARFLDDQRPIDDSCDCKVCKRYSRAYLRHLFVVGEYLAANLLTYHNLHFYIHMMKNAREAIQKNSFESFFSVFSSDYRKNIWL